MEGHGDFTMGERRCFSFANCGHVLRMTQSLTVLRAKVILIEVAEKRVFIAAGKDVVMWLRGNGCEWDASACAGAAEAGAEEAGLSMDGLSVFEDQRRKNYF